MYSIILAPTLLDLAITRAANGKSATNFGGFSVVSDSVFRSPQIMSEGTNQCIAAKTAMLFDKESLEVSSTDSQKFCTRGLSFNLCAIVNFKIFLSYKEANLANASFS